MPSAGKRSLLAEGTLVLVFHSQIRLTGQIFPEDYRDGFGGET